MSHKIGRMLAHRRGRPASLQPSRSQHTVFDWVAINIGLGVVVAWTDGHLLHITRTTSVITEDLLSDFVVLLGIVLLLAWARRSGQHIPWRGTLTEDGQPQAIETQPAQGGV